MDKKEILILYLQINEMESEEIKITSTNDLKKKLEKFYKRNSIFQEDVKKRIKKRILKIIPVDFKKTEKKNILKTKMSKLKKNVFSENYFSVSKTPKISKTPKKKIQTKNSLNR